MSRFGGGTGHPHDQGMTRTLTTSRLRALAHMRYNKVGFAAPLGIHSSMDTPGAGYGRCSDCNEIKHVMADGTVAAHNQYHSEGTSVAVVRCAGSGREPLDAKEEITSSSP